MTRRFVRPTFPATRSRGWALCSCLMALACSRPEAQPAAPESAAPSADVDADATPRENPPNEAEPAKEEAPPPPSAAERAQGLLTVFDQLGALHEANAEDCAALAQAIEGFANEHAEALADQPPEVHAWIDANEEARARMRAAMEPVMTASMACRKNREFAAVQAKLFSEDAAD